MAASRLHGLSCGEEAGARNLVFFRVKWLQPTMQGTSCVRSGCGWGRFMRELVSPLCSATSGRVCLRSSMRFLNLWLRIALEWLRQGCRLSCGEEAGARNLVFFRVKWLQPTMQGTSCVRRVRLGSFHARIGSSSVLQRVVVSVCVVLCVSWISGCGSHWNGCVKVAWAILWGGSRSTKPCVFPCKVAAADDARYLVCAAGAAGVVSCANWFLLCVLQRVVVSVCVVLCVSWISGCGSHWNGCVKVAWAILWGGSRSTRNLVFFRVKWLQATMQGTSCVRRVRLGSFHARIGSSSVFCNEWLCLSA